MLHLTQASQILLAVDAVDFRRGLDGLLSFCHQRLGIENTRSGQLFIFINRAHTLIRVLTYDGNGYWLATKRISRGRYQGWPKSAEHKVHPLLATELRRLLNQPLAFQART